MPPSPSSRALMRLRRLRVALGEFRWWAVLALATGLFSVVLAFTDQDLDRVLAAGMLSIALAVLATREEPS